jgi:mono/diheme cytochrome c family protein
MKTGRGFLVKLLSILVVLFVLIQLVPYGRNHTNPPVVREPNWDTPRTRALFMQTCGNCHSNETKWPWYSNVAPVSWLVQRDVDEGRSLFDASDWKPDADGSSHAWRMLEKGKMPPSYYLPLHPEARLSAQEKAELVKGLKSTFTVAEERKAEPGDHDG